jgi:hypothetical protein
MQDRPRSSCSQMSRRVATLLSRSFLLHPLAKSVRLAEEFQDVGSMSEPVEQCGGQALRLVVTIIATRS